MLTRRLYREDVYLKEAKAKIVRFEYIDDKVFVILNQSIFFPGGGGQSCDTGYINQWEMPEAYTYHEEIYHQLKDYDNSLKAGDEVTMKLNWDRRFDNMQRHCGEHILSGVIYDLYGGVNRGFHIGEDYMTIDMSLEEKEEYKTFTWNMCKKAELETNKIIWENLPVITRHFDTKEEAKDLPLRKPLNIEKDITIVSVGTTTKPADCVACCGTHPNLTGQVGMMKIYKVEPNKGMWRIYLEAGQRAYKAYQERYDVLRELENDLSAGFDDLLDKYNTRKEKNQAIKDRLYSMSKAAIDREVEDLKKDKEKVAVRYFTELTIDDLLEIGKKMAGSIEDMMVLVHQPTNTYLLFSDKRSCGVIVKDNARDLRGKGGGGKNNARAIFKTPEDGEKFIELLRNLE